MEEDRAGPMHRARVSTSGLSQLRSALLSPRRDITDFESVKEWVYIWPQISSSSSQDRYCKPAYMYLIINPTKLIKGLLYLYTYINILFCFLSISYVTIAWYVREELNTYINWRRNLFASRRATILIILLHPRSVDSYFQHITRKCIIL